jgi:hypothetical protein
VSIADRGIADEDEGGQVGVGGTGEAEVRLLRARTELRAARSFRDRGRTGSGRRRDGVVLGTDDGWRGHGFLGGESEDGKEAGEGDD